jgi:hypothetical protein
MLVSPSVQKDLPEEHSPAPNVHGVGGCSVHTAKLIAFWRTINFCVSSGVSQEAIYSNVLQVNNAESKIGYLALPISSRGIVCFENENVLAFDICMYDATRM